MGAKKDATRGMPERLQLCENTFLSSKCSHEPVHIGQRRGMAQACSHTPRRGVLTVEPSIQVHDLCALDLVHDAERRLQWARALPLATDVGGGEQRGGMRRVFHQTVNHTTTFLSSRITNYQWYASRHAWGKLTLAFIVPPASQTVTTPFFPFRLAWNGWSN